MATIIAICNQKGGVGKALMSVSLGLGFAWMGKMSSCLIWPHKGRSPPAWTFNTLETTLVTPLSFIIMDRPVFPGVGINHHEKGIGLSPPTSNCPVEVTLVNTISRETILREYLKNVWDEYDMILLDCCPSLSMLTINAIVTADEVLIPIQANYTSPSKAWSSPSIPYQM